MKRTTIKDIARHLSVSVSTVSRALSDDKNIRRETKEEILRVAEELGYRRNIVATNLRSGASNTIGVIVQEMVTPFTSTVVRGIQEVLYPLGKKVIYVDSNENPELERENLLLMERFMVDGIIMGLCSWKSNREEIERIQREGTPIVFFDRLPHGMEASQVIVDDYNKAFFLIEHLIEQGRRRIMLLQGPDTIYNFVERTRAYKDVMKKHRLPILEELMPTASMKTEEGARVVDKLLDAGVEFDALFAETDILAIGAMNRLQERGKRVPADVAVVSFSGSPLSTMVHPPLTTVEPPLIEMGKKSAELLLKRISNPESPHETIIVDSQIKLRASSCLTDK